LKTPDSAIIIRQRLALPRSFLALNPFGVLTEGQLPIPRTPLRKMYNSCLW
jgi:hypothetical protein